MSLPLAPWARDCAAFRGRGFSCPERTAPWRGRGPSRLVGRGGAAVPNLDDSGLDMPGADELDIGGRGLDPGASPPPSLQRLALWTSGAWFGRMTVS